MSSAMDSRYEYEYKTRLFSVSRLRSTNGEDKNRPCVLWLREVEQL